MPATPKMVFKTPEGVTCRDHARVSARIERSIRPNGDCWDWVGAASRGYGKFGMDGQTILAHRASYIVHVADIPLGLDLDHLCRNRRCVNPYHLEPVPRQVNVQRGLAAERTPAEALAGCTRHGRENGRIDQDDRGVLHWRCRICDRRRKAEYARKYYREHRDERLAYAKRYRDRRRGMSDA